MKKAIVVFLIVSLFLLGIEGCPKEVEEEVVPGLSMSFVKNAPPSTISVGQSVPIYVDIKNGGSINIGTGKAKFYLSGIGPNLENVEERLSNKKFLDKGISSERLKFATDAKSSLDLEMSLMLPLTLTTCYAYETIAEVETCIAGEESSVCSISGEKVTEKSNTLSPIQVTSLKEALLGDKLTITFIIENKGVYAKKPGEVYLENANCDILLDRTHEKYLDESLKRGYIDVDIIVGKGEKDFKCDLGDGTVSLGVTGKGKVVCEKTLSGEDYITAFKIILKYKYADSIATTITLLPSNK